MRSRIGIAARNLKGIECVLSFNKIAEAVVNTDLTADSFLLPDHLASNILTE